MHKLYRMTLWNGEAVGEGFDKKMNMIHFLSLMGGGVLVITYLSYGRWYIVFVTINDQSAHSIFVTSNHLLPLVMAKLNNDKNLITNCLSYHTQVLYGDSCKPIWSVLWIKMAAAATSPLASSVEKTNGAKLCRLLIDGGTTVLRSVFDGVLPPAT